MACGCRPRPIDGCLMGAHMPSCKCVRLRRLQSGRRPHYLARMATAALLLSAGGVTASKIPYVLAVTAQYHLGHVPVSHMFATSTALEHVRVAGYCLRRRLLEQVGELHAPYFIGTDTSTRGGTLGSYVVSFVLDGVPRHQFFAFDRQYASRNTMCTASTNPAQRWRAQFVYGHIIVKCTESEGVVAFAGSRRWTSHRPRVFLRHTQWHCGVEPRRPMTSALRRDTVRPRGSRQGDARRQSRK